MKKSNITSAVWIRAAQRLNIKLSICSDVFGKIPFGEMLDKRDIKISALNCSGNPLVNNPMGKAHSQTIHDTAELAGKLGVKTIVTMSGLPEAKTDDVTPNRITSTISRRNMTALTTWSKPSSISGKLPLSGGRNTRNSPKITASRRLRLRNFPDNSFTTSAVSISSSKLSALTSAR